MAANEGNCLCIGSYIAVAQLGWGDHSQAYIKTPHGLMNYDYTQDGIESMHYFLKNNKKHELREAMMEAKRNNH